MRTLHHTDRIATLHLTRMDLTANSILTSNIAHTVALLNKCSQHTRISLPFEVALGFEADTLVSPRTVGFLDQVKITVSRHLEGEVGTFRISNGQRVEGPVVEVRQIKVLPLCMGNPKVLPSCSNSSRLSICPIHKTTMITHFAPLKIYKLRTRAARTVRCKAQDLLGRKCSHLLDKLPTRPHQRRGLNLVLPSRPRLLLLLPQNLYQILFKR